MASIVFDETEIVLNPTCALFVTMEAPRAIQRKIPDNFKVVNYRIGKEMINSHYGGTYDDILLWCLGAFPKYCHVSAGSKDDNRPTLGVKRILKVCPAR